MNSAAKNALLPSRGAQLIASRSSVLLLLGRSKTARSTMPTLTATIQSCSFFSSSSSSSPSAPTRAHHPHPAAIHRRNNNNHHHHHHRHYSAASSSSLIRSSSWPRRNNNNHHHHHHRHYSAASSSSLIRSSSWPLYKPGSSNSTASIPLPLFTGNPRTAFQQQQQQQQYRTIFIQTDTTPNPESLKFIPNGRLVLGHTIDSIDTANPEQQEDEDGTIEIPKHNSTTDDNTHNNQGVHIARKDRDLLLRSPLAKSLFDLDDGIKSVYLGHDFLTVTKYAEAHWNHLQTPIFGAIMDFYASNREVMTDVPQITDTTILDDDDEVVAMIKELLESRIRPAVQEDGGDIKYVGYEEESGIVTVQLAGSCVGCPSSSVTLKNGVENMLMHYIPEVTGVVSLEEEEEEDGSDG
eukprot:CAMPEP_0183784890 /NCGR_PEP_ID=MMETSP0739-20130205/66222_1 /TAXON_ID=385413 /ORGANISM="Thalassiosira miniscula, Strain CCMP1093" /LENGTH=407 /DNA_ID=CAMNT_0026028881 /DNA_START=13 /DNA_END=1232 /DNA_ORIENTATION=+